MLQEQATFSFEFPGGRLEVVGERIMLVVAGVRHVLSHDDAARLGLALQHGANVAFLSHALDQIGGKK